MQITRANPGHLKQLAELFDRYRVFYQQPSDPQGSEAFIRDRLQKNDSVIYAAEQDGVLAGFTQLYPGFSSVSMQPIWILNDLYVDKGQRRTNVARRLMETARQHAIQTGALRIELATQIANYSAQKLYESLGYERDRSFYRYTLTL